MCLAVPMKVETIEKTEALVSAGAVKARVNIQLLRSLKKGEYVLVHAGIAIEKIDPGKAREALRLYRDVAFKSRAEEV
ncbi:MAG: HypC/HybG/HupF family hydrogenase formation chaperone [Candidatus Omnitrophica bacterium]|nr:HypC/HybG/HupF family hydrogenase formation chaperone [Candidatus Omnitrophota bacterium]MDD5574512.1 HypC/HybG/HupF family hydrogenase formation chaperone [Candidatus Omnitrophota bacterium]